MNKELSIVLRDKLVALPFIDLLAGLAQTVTRETFPETEEGNKITDKYPVSCDVLGSDCEGKEVALLPEHGRKSIIYFEDYGIASNGRLYGQSSFNSSLRLICWMNRANLVGDAYKNIGGRVMATIVDKLAGKNPENIDLFTRLTVELARIPPQDAGLFGRYSYKEEYRQYLRPPYEFFGIDFTCKYCVPSHCLNGINWNLQTCV